MNNDDKYLLPGDEALDRELDYLRCTLAPENAPPSVESALIKSFAQYTAASIKHHAAQNASAPSKPRRASSAWQHVIADGSRWLAPGLGFAASISMVMWMLLMPAHRAVTPTASPNAEAPFFALQSLEQIALEPAPTMIEARVPRMWLASYGMPVNPETATESVRAQVLMSAAGQPLAVRFAE